MKTDGDDVVQQPRTHGGGGGGRGLGGGLWMLTVRKRRNSKWSAKGKCGFPSTCLSHSPASFPRCNWKDVSEDVWGIMFH